MAYIKIEEVKEIRANIKKAFPAKDGWKFSITRRDYSEINVAIMKSPKAFGFEGYSSVNHFYIDENYADNDIQREALHKIHDIVSAKHWDDSDSQTDYFNCAFYININVGKWDNHCVSA